MGLYSQERAILLLLEDANVHIRRSGSLLDVASPERAEICQLADAGVAEAGGTEVGEEIGEDAWSPMGGRTKFWGLFGGEAFWRVEIWRPRTIGRAPDQEPRWHGLTNSRS